MDLYIHSPIRLHGVVLEVKNRENFSFFINLIDCQFINNQTVKLLKICVQTNPTYSVTLGLCPNYIWNRAFKLFYSIE
jgi:hypothetical protein